MSYSATIYQNEKRITGYVFNRTLTDKNILKQRLKIMVEMFPKSEGYMIKLMQDNKEINIEEILNYNNN